MPRVFSVHGFSVSNLAFDECDASNSVICGSDRLQEWMKMVRESHHCSLPLILALISAKSKRGMNHQFMLSHAVKKLNKASQMADCDLLCDLVSPKLVINDNARYKWLIVSSYGRYSLHYHHQGGKNGTWKTLFRFWSGIRVFRLRLILLPIKKRYVGE